MGLERSQIISWITGNVFESYKPLDNTIIKKNWEDEDLILSSSFLAERCEIILNFTPLVYYFNKGLNLSKYLALKNVVPCILKTKPRNTRPIKSKHIKWRFLSP